MSKVISISDISSRTLIGEKHHDFIKEDKAAERLSKILPMVSFITDADGAKFIPIQEVFRLESFIVSEKKDSYESGVSDGHGQGLSEGLEKAEEVVKNFDKAIADAVSQRELLLQESKIKILDLIIQVGKKVTYDAIEADPEKTSAMINKIIDGLIDKSKLKIKVNPGHLPAIEQDIDQFLKGSTSIKELKIEPDPRVKYGGCFIETPTGDIDARLESQFEVIEEVLKSGEE